MQLRTRTLASFTTLTLFAVALTGCRSDSAGSASAAATPATSIQSGSGSSAASGSTGSGISSGSGTSTGSSSAAGSRTPAIGSATLRWMPPATNTDGSKLTNLAGYYIHYGTKRSALDHVIRIDTVSLTTYVVGNLTSATYYFTVTSFTESGAESEPSSIVSKTI